MSSLSSASEILSVPLIFNVMLVLEAIALMKSSALVTVTFFAFCAMPVIVTDNSNSVRSSSFFILMMIID